jgi:transposase-like protein
LYVQGSEGASKWGIILEDLKRRGVEDVLVMCTDNLKGFSEVISETFPSTIVQKCIVHQVRNSLKYIDEKDRKVVVVDLRKIYTSPTMEQAQSALENFEVKWEKQYEYIVKQWRNNWEELMAFLDFPQGMRKMIYTTNPVEALHRVMRKLIKSKAAWVSETALTKQLYLSLKHNEKSWRKKAYGWAQIQRDIMMKYPERVPKIE